MKKLINFFFTRNSIYHIAITTFFAVISLAYFNPLLSGKALFQSDIVQFSGMAKQIVDHRESFNEEPYWLDNAFVGMPTFQVAVKYPFDILDKIDKILRFLPRPADYLFIYLLSFYILLISLKVEKKFAVIGAFAFAFSTYLIVILGVGHNTKALAIGYAPIAIAGVYNLFEKKYLIGFILATLGFGLQINANHYQMTYYFVMLSGLLALIHLFNEIKNKNINYKKYTGFIGAIVLAISLNSTSILATKEYTDFSTRGNSELTINPDGSKRQNTGGLTREYITEYSYGITESFNLIVPRFTGGGSGDLIDKDSNFFKNLRNYDSESAKIIYENARLYWGDQPIVEAPAYIGVTVFFLFVIGLFFLGRINLIWVLSAFAFTLFLSWGKNFSFLTDIFIDYFPFYNKFRAVSSIQVLIEFLVPFIAILGLYKFYKKGSEKIITLKKLLIVVLAFLSVFGILYFFGESLFDFKSNFEPFDQYPEILKMIIDERIIVYKSDILRSSVFVILCFGVLYASINKKIKENYSLLILFLIIATDLWSIDKKYVNKDDFVAKSSISNPFKANIFDLEIKNDKSDFRVFEPYRGLTNGRTSYFHKSISGYNAARPQKMQDLFDFYLFNRNYKVLDMLNVKYIIDVNQNNELELKTNENILGSAWFVDEVVSVESFDKEILQLNNIDFEKTAISQNISDKSYKKDPQNSIVLKKKLANKLIYEVDVISDQFAVFSEAYYNKGWNVMIVNSDDKSIDSKPLSHQRVNYLLRGMEVPAGKYELHFWFDPPIILTGSIISIFSILILLLSIGFYIKKSFNV
ncbi:MAG: hypothetical protein VXX96_04825 [Bacteroidota bacterium]|nr:hypothetical protein [Bacteroidota bacterium]